MLRPLGGHHSGAAGSRYGTISRCRCRSECRRVPARQRGECQRVPARWIGRSCLQERLTPLRFVAESNEGVPVAFSRRYGRRARHKHS